MFTAQLINHSGDAVKQAQMDNLIEAIEWANTPGVAGACKILTIYNDNGETQTTYHRHPLGGWNRARI